MLYQLQCIIIKINTNIINMDKNDTKNVSDSGCCDPGCCTSDKKCTKVCCEKECCPSGKKTATSHNTAVGDKTCCKTECCTEKEKCPKLCCDTTSKDKALKA
jgi:hypothetical protein